MYKKKVSSSPLNEPKTANSSEEYESSSEEESKEDTSSSQEEVVKSKQQQHSPVKPARSKAVQKKHKKSLTPSKRGVEGEDAAEHEGKKSNLEVSVARHLFQRLWSDEDEIVILQGIIDYVDNIGDPFADLDSFFEVIKGSIHVDVNRSQLYEKIRRLKRKYKNNSKRRKDGGERKFSKAHDKRTFDLSNKIWGVEGVLAGLAEKKHSVIKKEDPVKSNVGLAMDSVNKMIQLHSTLNGGKFDEDFVKEGMKLLGPEKAKEFERKLVNLQLEEMDICRKRAKLVSEHAESIVEAFKKKLG